MKSIVIAIISILCAEASTCQPPKKNNFALDFDFDFDLLWDALLIEDHKPISIFNSASQESVKYTIKNDTLTEEYMHIKILSKKGDFFNVKTASPFNEKDVSEGWIESKEVGTYLRPRNSAGDVPIYSSSSRNSEFKIVNERGRGPVEIIDIKPNGWFKVKIKDKGEIIIGWLSKYNQCPNPYSTCN